MLDIESGDRDENNHKTNGVPPPLEMSYNIDISATTTTNDSNSNSNNNSNSNSNNNNNKRRSVVEDAHTKRTIVEDSLSGGVGSSNNNNNDQQQPPPPPGQTRSKFLADHKSPASASLPLTNIVTALANKAQKEQRDIEPKLLHPFLSKIPLQFRFGLTGLLSNLLFMVVYNIAVRKIKVVPPSVIYAVVYFFFIPASHWMLSLLVFGWPERYLKSLLSNYPIGLTALTMGGLLTAYFDQAGFNDYVSLYIRDNFFFSTMPSRDARIAHEEGEFYSSIVVLIVTSIWTYVLSVYVNTPPANTQKKEL